MIQVEIRDNTITLGTKEEYRRIYGMEPTFLLIVNEQLDIVILRNPFTLGEWIEITGCLDGVTFDYAIPQKKGYYQNTEGMVWAYPKGSIFGEGFYTYSYRESFYREIMAEVLAGRILCQKV
jgi:hypothetical protein